MASISKDADVLKFGAGPAISPVGSLLSVRSIVFSPVRDLTKMPDAAME